MFLASANVNCKLTDEVTDPTSPSKKTIHTVNSITEYDVVEIDTNYKLGEQIVELIQDEDNNGNNGKEYLWQESKGYKSNFDFIKAEIDKNDVHDEDDYIRIELALSELVDRIKVHDQNYYVFGKSYISQVGETWIVVLPYAHLN